MTKKFCALKSSRKLLQSVFSHRNRTKVISCTLLNMSTHFKRSAKLYSLIIIITYEVTVVNLIVVPTTVVRYEDPKNREFIDEVERIKPKSLSCLNEFVSKFANQEPFRITIFLTELCVADLSNVYLSTILDEYPKFITSNDSYFWTNQKSSNILMILHDYECLKNISYNLVSLCTDECFYIVFLTKYFNDRNSFMEESEALINILWTRKIGNAVILGEINDVVLLVKSISFKSMLLRTPSKPVELDECNQLKRWGNLDNVKNTIAMHHSSINIAYFDQEPYVKTPTPDNENFSGLEISLMNVLANNLKMSINLSSVEWGNGTDFLDEIQEEFDSDRAIDLVIGGILWNPTELVDFTEPYDIVEIIWLVPVHPNISLQGLVMPFDNKVWYAVGGVLLFAIILKFLFFHELTFLEIWSLLLGYSWPKQPTRDSYRINYISWVIFGFLLTQYYLVTLAGLLISQSEVHIEKMAELVDSGFSYGGMKSHQSMLGDPDDDDYVMKTLSENFVVFEHEDYEKLLHDLIDGSNSSFALTVMLNMSAMETKLSHNHVHVMDEILTSAPIAFPVWKGLPYLSSIDQTILRLVQSGIIQHLASIAAISDNVRHTDEKNDAEEFIDSQDLVPAFLLFVMGSTAGLICLLLEIAVSLWKKRNKKSKKAKNASLKIKPRKRNASKRKIIKRIESNSILKPNVEVGYTHGYNIRWKEV